MGQNHFKQVDTNLDVKMVQFRFKLHSHHNQSNQKSKSVFGIGNEQITILCDETNKK